MKTLIIAVLAFLLMGTYGFGQDYRHGDFSDQEVKGASLTLGSYNITPATGGVGLDFKYNGTRVFTLGSTLSTAFAFTGTYTKGLNFASAVLTPGSDNALVSIGSISTPKVLPTLTGNYIPLQVYLESQANPASEYSLIGGYFKASATTAHQANTQLVGLASRVNMAKNCLDAYGLQSHVLIYNGANSTGNMTAVSGKVQLHGDNSAGIVSGILSTIEGHNTPTTAYGVWADIDSAHITAIYEGHTANAGTAINGFQLDATCTNGVNMNGSTLTTDIVLQNEETISNSTDGTIALGGNASVSGTTLLSGALTASVLPTFTIAAGQVTLSTADSAGLAVAGLTTSAIVVVSYTTSVVDSGCYAVPHGGWLSIKGKHAKLVNYFIPKK